MLIADTMHFTKEKNIPGVAVFLDFEKAFDSIHKGLETFNFGLDLRQWIKVFYTDISSCFLNNGYVRLKTFSCRTRSASRLPTFRHIHYCD